MRHVRMTYQRRHPVVAAGLLAVVGSGVGYSAAAVFTGKVRDALIVASTALLFGAFFGGVVKLLLEDVQRSRDRAAEEARFVREVLGDLMSVYDRVERVRILIAAHRSALTYGNEMRDLIQSRVQLSNVNRALASRKTGLLELDLEKLQRDVQGMENYLKSLTDEFRNEYKPIADQQRIYEGHFNKLLKETKLSCFTDLTEAPTNPAWPLIEQLPRLREFRRDTPEEYDRHFKCPLEHASNVLHHALEAVGDLQTDHRSAEQLELPESNDENV